MGTIFIDRTVFPFRAIETQLLRIIFFFLNEVDGILTANIAKS